MRGGGCRAPPSDWNVSRESSTHPVARAFSGGLTLSFGGYIVARVALRMNVSPAWPGCLCVLYMYSTPSASTHWVPCSVLRIPE